MNIVLLALVGVVLIVGLVALAVGSKGWSWGTVVAGFLVLLSACGFLFLAARVAERERAWRATVSRLQTDIARQRDAMVLDANGARRDDTMLPLPSLRERQARWERARNRVETWRERFWEKAIFQPPRPDEPGKGFRPGSLVIALPGLADAPAEAEVGAPINPGARLFIFDDTDVEEGGRFLGTFSVVQATVNKAEESVTLGVVPVEQPTGDEAKLWDRDYESVTVFENLPADRWFAFSRTKQSDDDAVLPVADSAAAEKLLKDLEKQLDQFERHETPVPQDEWRKLAEEKTIETGRYWATVEFTEPHAVPARQAAADAEPREPTQFEAGQSAEFDLETALALEQEKVAEIKEVVYRRPLTDSAIALEGGVLPADGDASVRALGVLAMRRSLNDEIVRITATIKDLRSAVENAGTTLKTLQTEETELRDDLARWRQDVTAATEVASAFDERLTAAGRILGQAWESVVQLGREFDGSVALLQADVDRRTPPAP